MARFSLLLLLALIVVVANAVPKRKVKFNRRGKMIHGRRSHGLVPRPSEIGAKVANAVEEGFTQVIDHFGSGSATFNQRYWYSDVYYQKGGPVFLMIEGEAEASSAWIERQGYPFNTMAKAHNAMMFVLEHRYYGYSQPFNDLTVAHLKYLSSRQALEDTAAFIKAMNDKFGLSDAKWITFGGSYSGALSAWMREKHPDLVYGAVATSGPVLAEVNFIEYLDTVQTALTEQDPHCAENVHTAFMKVFELMKTTSGKQQINNLFNPCTDLTSCSEDDIKAFYDALMGNYMGIVQYGGDNAGEYRTTLTVKKICSFHLDDSVEPLQQLANFNSWYQEYEGQWCLYNMFQGTVDCIADESLYGECADWRTWVWQTCTEFAYFYVAQSPSGFFGYGTDLDYFAKQCQGAFGSQYDLAAITAAVNATNAYYGGNTKYTGTNVVLPNGSWDPWHPLGILQSKYPSYVAAYMKGTAHCANMYPPASDDLDSLKTGRETIQMQVATWVNQ